MPYVWDGDFGPDEPATEDRIACAFAERHAGELRYCAEHRAWYVFDGAVWRRDRTGLVIQRAREVARDLGGRPHPQVCTARQANAGSPAQTMRFVAGVERFARADPAFAVAADVFDADPFLLGTPAGPVALRSGRRLAADPSQNLTRTTAVAPAEAADCPRWLAFLNETFGDPALVRFLQQFLGYALTGDTSEQVLLFGHGTGGNGKSVLARTVGGIMGDYAATVAPGTFTSAGLHRNPSEIARLESARLAIMAETEAGGVWDETRLKLLTGGDPVTARFLRRDAFTFTPQFKLIVIGNHRPALARVDEAVRRRLLLLPFKRRPEAPDRRLAETLRAEWPAILRWMIEGCLDWQANGLVTPARVREATDTYLGGQDVLGQFLADKCLCAPGDDTRTVTAGKLFEAWSAYAREAGEPAGSQRALAEAMLARGFARGRTAAGAFFSGSGCRERAVEMTL